MELFCRHSSDIWDFAIMCGIMHGIMCGHLSSFLSPSFVIINAKPPIRNALNSARLAFSNHTKPPPNNISTIPKTVVFQLRKILSIIFDVSVPTPHCVHERGQHHKQTRYLMHLCQRQPTYGQTPRGGYCACTIVLHS